MSQTQWNDPSFNDGRVEALLEQLTLEDKVRLVSGQLVKNGEFAAPAGMPLFTLTDGPAGVRTSPDATTAAAATAMPAPIALAATWDSSLAEQYGNVLGAEAAATGHNVLLGPAVDIARIPVGGRTFESFGEDPLLQSRLIVPEVQAIQRHGVMVCLKHYVVNNQERDRNSVNVHVDSRALFEIYLPPFEAAIKLGGAASLMASYNQINGDYACENPIILNQTLRDELGFRGFVMSDFLANHSTAQSANAGLGWELTMPHVSQWRSKLLEAVGHGDVRHEVLDEMVRRILRPTVGLGLLEPKEQREIPVEVHAKIALEIAEQGMVLLKNVNQFLPLSSAVKSIAVIGADASNVAAAGGGSALVQPLRAVSVLEGLLARAGDDVLVDYAPGADPVTAGALLLGAPAIPSSVMRQSTWHAQYWDNLEFAGVPKLERAEPCIEINRGFLDMPGFKVSPTSSTLKPLSQHLPYQFSARFTGTIIAPASGEYVLNLTLIGTARLFVANTLVLEVQNHDTIVNPAQRAANNNGIPWGGAGAKTFTHVIRLEENQELEMVLEYLGDVPAFGFLYGAQLRLGWQMPEGTLTPAMKEAVKLAQRSELAVIVARTFETEAMDRPDLFLPNDQARLIRAVVSANPNTVVVLMTGSSVETGSWQENVPAILEAWFAGQEQGFALARVLFGDTNPSGKLPLTFGQGQDLHSRLEYPGENGEVYYSDGLNVGYRAYDSGHIKPQYEFGFGLSYTSFEYSNLEVNQHTLRFEIKNTGQCTGIEIAQLYLEPSKAAKAPPKKLAGWARVKLQAGETRQVTIELDADSLERPFSSWNMDTNSWEIVPGEYGVLIGASSRDIRLTGQLMVTIEAQT